MNGGGMHYETNLAFTINKIYLKIFKITNATSKIVYAYVHSYFHPN